MKQTLIVIAVAALVIAAMLYATLSQGQVECAVCVRYNDREACKSAIGADREIAERSAVTAACAIVTGGVTETIGCLGRQPVSLTCQGN